MTEPEPVTELSAFSSGGAIPTEWEKGRRELQDAEVYWLSTVRPDGRPHVTPLLGIWLDGALYFCTGPGERKAKNLARNPHCILTTGCNRLDGLDLVVEGQATKVSDPAELRSDDVARLAALGLPGQRRPDGDGTGKGCHAQALAGHPPAHEQDRRPVRRSRLLTAPQVNRVDRRWPSSA
jgi:hypothetical protein